MNVSAFNHLFYLPPPIEKRRLPASLYHPTYKSLPPTTYSERSQMRWDRRKDIELLVGQRDEWVGIASITPSLRILVSGTSCLLCLYIYLPCMPPVLPFLSLATVFTLGRGREGMWGPTHQSTRKISSTAVWWMACYEKPTLPFTFFTAERL